MNPNNISVDHRVRHYARPDLGVGIVESINQQAGDAFIRWANEDYKSLKMHYLTYLYRDPLDVIYGILDELTKQS